MGKRIRGFVSSIAFVSSAAATSAFACDGIPCVPTSCLAEWYAHGHSQPAITPLSSPVRTSGGLVTGNLVPLVGPQLPGASVKVGPNAFPGAGNTTLGGGPEVFASRNIVLQSQVTLAQMGGVANGGASLHGWVDPQTRHEYAIMGLSNGTAFVDITNPTNPVVTATLPKIAGTPNELWREPKVYGNTVYVGVDRQSTTAVGMQIMDLTKLRNYTGTTMTLAADNVYNGVTRIHTLGINPDSGYLYLAGTNVNGGGLRVMDVKTNPLNPTVAGNTTLDGYTHETQVVTYHGPDTQHQGKEIAFNSNGPNGVLSILDMTNKSAITRLSATTYTNERYIHQGWLTEDQKYFFQNDELDEPGVASRTRTHLWDVSNLDSPVYRGHFDNTTPSIDHNLYVKGDYVYETNYTSGLRILKIGDLTSTNSSDWLTEVAFFDTYAANDGATFNGAWNNYPYFPSGNIAISDINGGLFIVKPTIFGKPFGESLAPIGLGPPTLVPEPASMAVVFAGGALAMFRRRRVQR